MQSHLAGEVTVNLDDPGDVHEVFAELERRRAEVIEVWPPLQPLCVVVAHHRYTASRGRAYSAQPEFAMGWPQHVCSSGKSTSTPRRRSTRRVASPTCGCNWST